MNEVSSVGAGQEFHLKTKRTTKAICGVPLQKNGHTHQKIPSALPCPRCSQLQPNGRTKLTLRKGKKGQYAKVPLRSHCEILLPRPRGIAHTHALSVSLCGSFLLIRANPGARGLHSGDQKLRPKFQDDAVILLPLALFACVSQKTSGPGRRGAFPRSATKNSHERALANGPS